MLSNILLVHSPVWFGQGRATRTQKVDPNLYLSYLKNNHPYLYQMLLFITHNYTNLGKYGKYGKNIGFIYPNQKKMRNYGSKSAFLSRFSLIKWLWQAYNMNSCGSTPLVIPKTNKKRGHILTSVKKKYPQLYRMADFRPYSAARPYIRLCTNNPPWAMGVV